MEVMFLSPYTGVFVISYCMMSRDIQVCVTLRCDLQYKSDLIANVCHCQHHGSGPESVKANIKG